MIERVQLRQDHIDVSLFGSGTGSVWMILLLSDAEAMPRQAKSLPWAWRLLFLNSPIHDVLWGIPL